MQFEEYSAIFSCCDAICSTTNLSDADLVVLIKQCTAKCIQMDHQQIYELLQNGKLIERFIRICYDISNPFNTNDVVEYSNVNKLVLVISQFIVNMTVKGGPFLVLLWESLSRNNFIGYQNLICACKRVNSPKALEATIASLYNCMVKGYNS